MVWPLQNYEVPGVSCLHSVEAAARKVESPERRFMDYLAPIRTQKSIFTQLEQGRLNGVQEQAESGIQKTDEEMKILSRQFESIFVHQLLKSMRSTVQKSGLLESHASEMFESMYDQELANIMSQKRSMGLADMVYKDLVRLEQKAQKARSTAETLVPGLNPVRKLPGQGD